MRKQESEIVISSSSSGDWKVVAVGGAFVVAGVGIGVGAAILAAQVGAAIVIVAVGASISLAAIGIGRGIEYVKRGNGAQAAGQAMIEAAKRGHLPAGPEADRLLPSNVPEWRRRR